jgi:hypothetical protein
MDSADFAALTSSQMAAFGTDEVAALSTTQLLALDTAHISAFTATQLNAMGSADLNALSTTQWASLTTRQIAGLSTDHFDALTTSQLAAFTTAQVAGLTTAQIAALTTAQIAGLESADIAAMTTTQVNGFEQADVQVMNTAQFNALMSVTPIVLDIDGGGVQTLAAAEGVQFDLTGTGHQRQWGWVGGGDGLLAMDRNGDGVINDGRELFGAATVLADGQRAGHGFAALAAEDTNQDGVVTAADARFNDMKVWVDGNHDGQTDAGELKGLVELGITGLNVAHAASDRIDHGNALGLVSSYTTADGQSHEMADVWFSRASAAPAAPPALGELLSGPPETLLPGSDSGASAASAGPVAAAALHKTAADEDWMRTATPLL